MFIAVSGKGGVGKSTVSALIIRNLVLRRGQPILAVDADPNFTLGEKLGAKVDYTIGDLRENVQQSKYDAPAGTPKQRAVEYEMQQAITEGAGFDLVTMGRGEGPGCYCSLNNMLRTFLQDLTKNYPHVVIDNEAGMEHLSRRTNARIGLMLVVSDPTPTSLQAAGRIRHLAESLGIVEGRMGLVINRLGAYQPDPAIVAATGLEVLGTVPDDPQLRECEMRGLPVTTLPAEAPSVQAMAALLRSLGV